LPKVGLAQADFYFGRLARAREHVQTPNWSPPEYVVLFSAVLRRKVRKWDRDNWKATHSEGWNWQISPRSSDPQPWKSSQPRFCAKHRCIRSRPKCHAQVWHFSGGGV